MSYEAVSQARDGIRVYGDAAKFWRDKSPQIVLSGPFETGKTFAALHKLDALLWKYGGARALIVRQTYQSCLSSVRVTYEDKIMVEGTPVQTYGGERPEFYMYPNGSVLYLGGLDKPTKFLSSEWDYIYINQAEEVAIDAFEMLCARATGRSGNVPYPQVMADCNPGPPMHWILQKRLSGDLQFYEQFHRDNPVLYNQDTGELTTQGVRTMGELNKLTGLRRERGLLNRWVAAEGVVYDNFTIGENVTADAEYNPDLAEVYWGVDDGYAHGGGPGTGGYHPRAVVLAQLEPNGFVNIFDEYYRTLQLPESTINELLEQPYHRPEMAMVDSSAAELRRRLNDYDVDNIGATHRVADGIKNMRRFVLDGNGVRLLRIHPRCVHLINEIQSYRYDPNSKQSEAGEPKPEKANDHLMDAIRYLLWMWRWE